MGMDIQSLTSLPDPTQAVLWDTPGPTSDAVIQPGIGAGLILNDDQGARKLETGIGATAGLALGGVTLVASQVNIGWDNTDRWTFDATTATLVINNTNSILGTSSQTQFRNMAAKTVRFFDGNGVGERWRVSSPDFLGQPDAVPGDNSANPSPTITLRQVIDPLGAPVAQNVDAVNQHMNIAIGGGGVAQTLWQFRIDGVQALGLFWDEATGQCALEVPAWNTAVTPPVRNGQFVFDVLNPAGFSFFGSKAGAWVGVV